MRLVAMSFSIQIIQSTPAEGIVGSTSSFASVTTKLLYHVCHVHNMTASTIRVLMLVLAVAEVVSVALRAEAMLETQGPPIYLPRKRCEICVTVVMRKVCCPLMATLRRWLLTVSLLEFASNVRRMYDCRWHRRIIW